MKKGKSKKGNGEECGYDFSTAYPGQGSQEG